MYDYSKINNIILVHINNILLHTLITYLNMFNGSII